MVVDPYQPVEAFRGLLLRHRGRTELTQRELASRLGVHSRWVQDWKAGANYPTAERLQTLIGVLLEVGGLSTDSELPEAEALWVAVERDSARMHAPFDRVWFARLLAGHTRALPATTTSPLGSAARASRVSVAERRQDWAEAPAPLAASQ